jgi:hypothetical protein
MLGFLTGAVIFGLTYDKVLPLLKLTQVGSVTLPDLWNVSSFLFITFFVLMALLLFYLIDRAGLQRANHDQ